MLPVMEPFLDEVHETMREATLSEEEKLQEVVDHALGKRGKMLRPTLVGLAYQVAGGPDVSEVAPLAASIELIHLATLIHDDINDRSSIRRGRKTAHTIFGEDIALVTGDYLFARGFDLAISYGETILRSASRTCFNLAEGEVLQSRNMHNPDLDMETYLKIVELKTARIFAASTEAGANAAEADGETVEALWNYGRDAGMGFQMKDDLIDLVGDREAIGKERGIDLLSGKNTILTIHGISHLEGADRTRLSDFISQGISREEIPEAIDLLEKAGSFRWAETEALRYLDLARKQLEPIPDSHWKGQLLTLTDLFVTRSF